LEIFGTQKNADLRETSMTGKKEMGVIANFYGHFCTGEIGEDLRHFFFGYYFF